MTANAGPRPSLRPAARGSAGAGLAPPRRANRLALAVAAGSLLLILSSGCKRVDAQLVRLRVRGHEISAEVVADRKGRAKGLMYRPSLPEDHGMLFVYPDEQILSFWMANTTIPLSIAYLDREGTINEIHYLRPLDPQSVPSIHPARFALEMNAGWFEERKIVPGDRIELPESVLTLPSESP